MVKGMANFGDFLYPYRCKSIYHRRCDAIEYRLKEHNINAVVSRHTAFDVEYYVLDFKDSSSIDKCKIADALDIPKDWVDFINIYDEGCVYFIKEDEFNDKYCDCDGEIDWGFNLFDLKFESKFETLRPIKDQLESAGITVESVGIYDDYLMIKIDGCPKCSIAKALNCPESMVNSAIFTPQYRLYVIPRWDR